MDDLISRRAVDQNIYDFAESNGLSYANLKNYILDVPSVTPTHKKGHWIFAYGNRKDGDNTEKCSSCKSYWKQAILYDSETGDFLRQRLNYCPNCGTRMEVDE